MKCLRHFFSKFLKDKNGFTLVELMIGFGAMAGLMLVTMELTKQQKAQIVEAQVESDVAQMKAKIQAILSTPQHCNANFHIKSESAEVDENGFHSDQSVFTAGDFDGIQAIYTCDSSRVDACIPSPMVTSIDRDPFTRLQRYPGNRVALISVKSGSDWTNTGSASNRVRISAISISITGIEDPSDEVCDLYSEDCGRQALPGLNKPVTTLAWMGVTFGKKYLNKEESEKFVFYIPLNYSKLYNRPWGCVFAWLLMDELPRIPPTGP